MVPEMFVVCFFVASGLLSFLFLIRKVGPESESESEPEPEPEPESEPENTCPICYEDIPNEKKAHPCHQRMHWICIRCNDRLLGEGKGKCWICRDPIARTPAPVHEPESLWVNLPRCDRGGFCIQDGDTGYCIKCETGFFYTD